MLFNISIKSKILINFVELFDSKTPQRSLHSSFADFISFINYFHLSFFFVCIVTVSNKKCLSVKKRFLLIFRKVSGVFQRNFNGSKIVLSSSRGQGNFRGLEALRPRASKCVLEAKDVLKDSTSGFSSKLKPIFQKLIFCHTTGKTATLK